jgi:hypothetical protein
MTGNILRNLGLVAALAIAMLVPQTANAACGTAAPRLLSYTFNMQYAVTAIAKFNSYTPDCGSSISNSDTASVGASDLTDVFAKRDPVGRSLLFGVATDLPRDEPGQQHLVLFTNTSWASSASSVAFGTLFPSVNEASLIDALLSLANGTGTSDDYAKLFGFAEGGTTLLFSPNGDPAFQFGDDFTAIAFSDGQIIGSGSSFSTLEVSAAPEPAAWAMMIVGFGVAGTALRRRGRRLQVA